MKYAIFSGIAAGIIAAIIGIILTIFVMNMGLPYLYYGPPSHIPLVEISIIEIVITLIFGVILSIIFLKTFDVIPGKRFSKYIIYGLFCHLVLGIRLAIFGMAYFNIHPYISWLIIGFPKWIAYALVLGFLYEILIGKKYIIREEKKIITYNMKSGALVGAIAGIVGGIVAFLTLFICDVTVPWAPYLGQNISERIQAFWALLEIRIYQFGAHVFIHLLWGTIFGAIFARVYNLVPGKGMIKGLYYGLVLALITGFHTGAFYLAYWFIQPLGALVPVINIEFKEFHFIQAQTWVVLDLAVYVVYGLLIGKLFKK